MTSAYDTVNERNKHLAEELAEVMYPAPLSDDETLLVESRVKYMFARRMLALALETEAARPMPTDLMLDQHEDFILSKAMKGVGDVLAKMDGPMAVEIYEKALGVDNG